MNQVPESILNRVQKLLRLSDKSDHVNESAAAMAAAQRLIDEYNIDVAELRAKGEGAPAEPFEEHPYLFRFGERAIGWKAHLANVLAKNNLCRVWTHVDYDKKTGEKYSEIRIIGRKSNVEIVQYLFAFVSTEIERLCATAMRTQRGSSGKAGAKTWSNQFKMGCIDSISAKLDVSRAQVQQAYQGTPGLVLVKKDEEELGDFYNGIAAKYKLRTVSRPAKRDYDARTAGREAGKNIHLGAALGVGSGRLLNK